MHTCSQLLNYRNVSNKYHHESCMNQLVINVNCLDNKQTAGVDLEIKCYRVCFIEEDCLQQDFF